MVMVVACTLFGCGVDAAPQKSIVVHGAASSGAVEYGKASWYGGKFHGRRTASGEVYDQNKLTAAHKSLPFGAQIRVTEKESRRSVVVRINDRMPDTAGNRGRVIDLSRAAFLKLALLERGLLEVKLEPVR
jgi:rare lipoprotein A